MKMNRHAIGSLLLVLLVIVGMTVPAMAISASSTDTSSHTQSSLLEPTEAQVADQNNSSVTVSVGHQLATVLTVSSDDVQTEFEHTAFELSLEHDDDEDRAEAIANRSNELRDRAEAIHEDYEEATESYQEGEITKSVYAQRLASLNARANNLLSSYEILTHRAHDVSALELQAAGANFSSLNTSIENLHSVTGAGTSALLAQFLGEADGEIKLEINKGVKIEIERDNGEFSREFDQSRDDNMDITVSHDAALQSARSTLASPAEGRWVLVESKIKPVEGAYEFEFMLGGAQNLTGEAEVRVDGSTGEVYRLEQETEQHLDDEDEQGDEADEELDDLMILVVDGVPEPNASITIQVIANGQPIEGAVISIADREVGRTNSNGTFDVTLPDTEEVELSAEKEDADGELSFEFEDESDSDRVFSQLDVTASLQDDVVSVEVKFDNKPVRNATIYANGDRVDTTDADGRVTFRFDEDKHEDLELEVVKGEFEAELAYAIQNGTFILVEEEHDNESETDREDEGEDDADADEENEEDSTDHEDDSSDKEEDDEEEDQSLSMSVIQGAPGPSETITVEVLADGEPVEDATITVEGEFAGTTDAHGTLEITLPAEDSIELRAEYGDAEARLEFDFEEDDSDESETGSEED